MSPTQPGPASDAAPRPEATVRALIAGAGLGAVLAAAGVYAGLKTSLVDGGGIAAALVGFMFFTRARPRYSTLENNITATTAASAGVMAFVAGVAGPIPALGMMGIHLPGWTIAVLGTAAGVLGIAAGMLLRRKLVVDDALPFPTGNATGEVIETIHAARASAFRRARVLLAAAALAVLVTWFRDGRPAFIPQMTAIGGVIGGFTAASLTLGFSWSPVLLGTGAMMGLRSAASMLIGGTVAWGVLAPWLVRNGIVRELAYGPLTSWLTFPGLGLLIAGSFVPLLLQSGSVLRSLRDLGSVVDRRRVDSRLTLLALAGVLGLVLSCWRIGIGPGIAVLAVLLALLLANVSARATGETDIGPVGAVGLLTQLAFSAGGPLTAMVAGWITTGTSSQTAQTLWAFKAGHRLGASPRAQVGAQLLGALVGGVVVVPVYILIVKGYGIGTEAMPAASALSWRAMAEAVSGALPPHGPLAGAIGLSVGTVLVLLARTRAARFLPSPSAIGLAMLIPASYSVTALGGALLVIVARKLRPELDESLALTAAAGGIAGESVMGVIVAALTWAGVL
jgi:uncharacterized oligopeptide transporter (OPT) family protein